jgi:hypothetical protein
VPVVSARVVAAARPRLERLYVPLGTLVSAWQFLREGGAGGCEQMCFLAGRWLGAPEAAAAQVTSCVLPLTVATAGHVTLTSHLQTALILDHLEARAEVPLASIHTHPDGGTSHCGPEHSTVDDRGVALVPEDGLFSIVVPHYAFGSPFAFPGHCGVYERWEGRWHRVAPESAFERLVVHGDTLRIARREGEAA